MSQEKAFRLEITDLGGTDGIGRRDGKAVFVPLTAPGDVILAEAVEEKKHFTRASLVSLLEASPERVEPFCPHYGDCGGCDWMHLERNAQQRYKGKLISDAAGRIARQEIEPPAISPVEPQGYRSKARLQVVYRRGRVNLGYYSRRSRHLVSWKSCPLLSDSLNNALGQLRGLFNSRAGGDPRWHQLQSVELETAAAGWAMTLRFERQRPPNLEWKKLANALEGLVSLRVSGKRDGFVVRGEERFLVDELPFKWMKTPGAFRQPSNSGGNWIREQVAATVKRLEPTITWDLYGGSGLLGREAMERNSQLWLVESDSLGASDAMHNLLAYGDRAIVTNKTTERALTAIPAGQEKPDLVIVDPPRVGLSKLVRESLLTIAPPALLYVGCSPNRFWRDAAELLNAGYSLEGLNTCEMLPQTHHLELTGLFLRGE